MEKSVSQIMHLHLPSTYLLIRMAYEGILTIVGWQPLISGSPALISGNLDKKSGATMDQNELASRSY